MFTRISVLSAVTLAALLFAVAACSSADDGPPPTPTPIDVAAVIQQQLASQAPAMAAPTAVPVAPAAPAPAAPPSATTFQDTRRTPPVTTAQDRVSTFSLDTDRTSYRLALTWAREGYQVEPDSVRAEEWVNSFHYGYPQPTTSDSFSISTDVFTHPLDSRLHLARVGFQAPQFEDTRPVNVTLVLDASGSMANGNRVEVAREAAYAILNSLGRSDRIAVVQFSTEVIEQYVVPHESPSPRGAVASSISQLSPRASTNVQAGLDLGVQLADEARRANPDAYNYVILMSDGVANVDATHPFAILESAYDPDAGNPLRIITIGVGIENYNDQLLEQLAQYGNGWYRYLDTVDQARTVFSRANWLALSIPFADQTRAQVTWDPNQVASWRLIGYENRVTSDESFTEARKEFAEIPAGAATTVYYELELTDAVLRSGAWPAQLGNVELRWVTPVSNDSNRQHASVTAGSEADIRYPADPLAHFGAIVGLAADLYSALPRAGDTNYAGVYGELYHLQSQLDSLSGQLGHLQSYQDFSFLLSHIMRDAPSGSTMLPSTSFTDRGFLDSSRRLLYGSAETLPSSDSIQLTPSETNQFGMLIHPQLANFEGLRIEFSFEIGGGTGADGLGLLLLRSMPDFSQIEPLYHAGGGWGSRYLSGYAVLFDTHLNAMGHPEFHGRSFYYPITDPSDNFVALAELGAGSDVFDITHLAVRNLYHDLSNSGVFNAEVELAAHGRVSVYLSNAQVGMERTLVIDHTIEDYTPFDGYIGFIGLTGAATDRHVIHSVKYGVE